jgi:hypothetical protein
MESYQRIGLVLVGLIVAVAGGVGSARAQAPPAPFVTGLTDLGVTPADYPAFLSRARAAGASEIRTTIDWDGTVGSNTPTPSEQSDPSYSGYDWADSDQRIQQIARFGLVPIVQIADAPPWAEDPLPEGASPAPKGGTNVNPGAYGRFAAAAARRYDGSSADLPAVRFWDAWNEPNISLFFGPQFVGGTPYSPSHYRAMLNAFADGVKSVSAANLVIAGDTAPFRDITQGVQTVDSDWGPLSFMRKLLCVSPTLTSTCKTKVRFDVWAHHPYTSGGPLHHAVLPNDVSLADLPKMKAVLDAAYAAGHIRSAHGKPAFWADEFSWDSKPPDPRGVPMQLLTRWVAEGFYRMWLAGVTHVTWLQFADLPLSKSFNQAGLYVGDPSLATAKAKPILRAYEFPFVAYPHGSTATVWGRTPASNAQPVTIEQRVGGEWRRLSQVRSASNGVFRAAVTLAGAGDVRARLAGGGTSIPFSLTEPPDQFFNPFGETTPLEPSKK